MGNLKKSTLWIDELSRYEQGYLEGYKIGRLSFVTKIYQVLNNNLIDGKEFNSDSLHSIMILVNKELENL